MQATDYTKQPRPFIYCDDLFSIKNTCICSSAVKVFTFPFTQETFAATVLRLTQISTLRRSWIKPVHLPRQKTVFVWFVCLFFKVNIAFFSRPHGAIQYLLHIRWPSPVLAIFLKVINKLKVEKRKNILRLKKANLFGCRREN